MTPACPFNVFLRQAHSLPPDWCWYEMDVREEAAPSGFVKVTGAVPVRINKDGFGVFGKASRPTRRVVFMRREDYEACCAIPEPPQEQP